MNNMKESSLKPQGLKPVNLVCNTVTPQSHIYDFGPGRATVHPDLASR